MAQFKPFSYADVVTTGEAVKGARSRNALIQQQLDPQSVGNQLQREQLTGARQGNILAQQAGQRAQTTFDQSQQEANTKALYQAYTEIANNPSTVEYHVPRLKEMGVLRGDFDYTNMTPEEIQARAAEGAQALGQALAPITKPSTPSTAAKNYSLALKQGYKKSFVDYQKELKKAGATNVNLGLTKGQEAVDRDYAKEYVDFKSSGGYADVDKQIAQLEEVQQKLAGGAELTGPVTGNIPDLKHKVINPEARSARDAVEEVVQRNLRLVLGAQFTEKEGERLIARAYNPKLDEAENLKRVTRLIDQIRQAAEAKKSSADYFEKNGTLKGYSGKQWSMSDFNPEKETTQLGGWTIEEM